VPFGDNQSTNDTNKTDFETNYKPTANATINRTDKFGNAIYTPINYAAAFGLLPGVNSGTVNGYVATSSTNIVPVRSTLYTAPAAAAQRSVSSSSANDTSAGTGARTILITYYDGTMSGPKTTSVTLNGTTAVATTATDIQFIERIEVITVGSTGINAGAISLFVNTSGGGGTIGSIVAGDNATFWGHHYVAAGKTAYLLGIRCSAFTTNGIAFAFATGSPLTANLAYKNITGSIRYGSGNMITSDYEWDIPLVVVGPNLIYAACKPDLLTASTTLASFDYFEF
jgi:hypothetical protein